MADGKHSGPKVKLFSLWENTSSGGVTYYSGRLGEARVIGFRRTDKKNPKEPDIDLYVQEPDKDGDHGGGESTPL